MRKLILAAAAMAAAMLLGACGPAANDATNRAANSSAAPAANSNAKPVDTAAIETEVKRLVSEAAVTMSKNDAAALEKATIDTYKFISPDGRVSTRAERVASMRSGDTKYESVVYDEVSVNANPYGTGAIVTGRATVKGVNMGQKVDGQFRITQIWRKTDDGWKMAHGHATAIAAGTSATNTSTTSTSPAANTNTNR
jgi:ketosteroid isomerase-like protein